jgi:hypothetical protein
MRLHRAGSRPPCDQRHQTELHTRFGADAEAAPAVIGAESAQDRSPLGDARMKRAIVAHEQKSSSESIV